MPPLVENTPQEFLGLGFYAVADAARLLNMPARKIRRWLAGYDYGVGENKRPVPPLWIPELPAFDDAIELSFRDLIELRFVNAFEAAGLGLKAIRNCLVHARDVVEADRPFSTSRFRTDGRTIFLESLDADDGGDDARLLDLKRNQYVFKRVLEQSFRDLDIEASEVARWRPYKGRDSIVIDPKRSFGQPIAAEFGVPTGTLADSVAAEGSIERVAAIFEMSVAAVRDAVGFESGLRAQ